MLSDTFITTVYTIMLGFLGFYGMYDYFSAKKAGSTGGAHDGLEGAASRSASPELQAVNLPPMVTESGPIISGGRKISWLFPVLSGALVGMAAGIMGVGGGFLTFPIFVYDPGALWL